MRERSWRKQLQMIDEFEVDEVTEPKGGAQPPHTFSSWRPKIGKRLLERLKLLAAWLRITVLPHYGWRAFFSIVLITGGRLADAASFVVGIHILTRSLPDGNMGVAGLQSGLAWAAASLAGILAVASILGYIGSSLAAKLVLDYESTCIVDAMSIVRHHQDNGVDLSQVEATNITRQAPRIMSRSLLHIINACTACVLTLIGLVACTKIFPALTAIVLFSLLLMSPLYIFATIHSTNTGHRIRLSTPGYALTMARLQKRWLSQQQTFDQSRIIRELQRDSDFIAYLDAYRARLTLPARNALLSSLTLAFVVALSFVWIANEVELSTRSITAVVSYLVFLRLFAHGLAGIFHGLQSINASLPLYLLFLTRDPRLAKWA